jgi:hypothetical protein
MVPAAGPFMVVVRPAILWVKVMWAHNPVTHLQGEDQETLALWLAPPGSVVVVVQTP